MSSLAAQSHFPLTGANADPIERQFSLKGRVFMGTVFAIFLLGGVGGWAGTAELSGAVIGMGSVLVDDDIKVVQHADGGVLREISVREGDTVTAGQVLLRLEDAEIGAEKAIVEGQLVELEAQLARLFAEARALENITFSHPLLETHPDARSIIQGEQHLFLGNLARHRSQSNQLMLQVDQLKEEINGLEFQRTATDAELGFAQMELDRLKRLFETNLVEASRVSSAERDVVRLRGQTGDLDTAIARARVRISDVELQLLELDGARETDAQRQLRVVEAQIAELEERLRASVARYARTNVLAPVSGTINELNVTTLGGVISPAERLLTIVPRDADLTIEFRIAISDIDQVHVGQPATLRFSAFNHRTTPEVEGEIVRVSAAAQQDNQSGDRFYLAQVRADQDSLTLTQNQLVPGMPVEVFVETERQLAIAYFLKPFTDQVTRAFREE